MTQRFVVHELEESDKLSFEQNETPCLLVLAEGVFPWHETRTVPSRTQTDALRNFLYGSGNGKPLWRIFSLSHYMNNNCGDDDDGPLGIRDSLLAFITIKVNFS